MCAAGITHHSRRDQPKSGALTSLGLWRTRSRNLPNAPVPVSPKNPAVSFPGPASPRAAGVARGMRRREGTPLAQGCESAMLVRRLRGGDVRVRGEDGPRLEVRQERPRILTQPGLQTLPFRLRHIAAARSGPAASDLARFCASRSGAGPTWGPERVGSCRQLARQTVSDSGRMSVFSRFFLEGKLRRKTQS